jgi:acetyl-CoA C-acetyltransferase
MSSVDPARVAVVLGVGQRTDRTGATDPITLAAAAAQLALDDAGGATDLVQRVHVVNILAGGGPAPARAVAERLGMPETVHASTTTIGGNTPQWLVGRAADDIAAGAVRTVLVAGAEAMHSLRAGHRPDVGADGHAAAGTGRPDPVEGDARPGLSPVELAAGLAVPAHVYPMMELVLAHRAGHTLDEHRQVLGTLLAGWTEVAAANPYAWFRDVRDARTIATPTAGSDNRLVSEPYTKLMHAFLGVDQGAALVVTSLDVARRLGREEQAVFLWGQGDATDVWFPSQRPDLGRSPGIAAAAGGALAAAGIGIDDVRWLDLYSCFPVAVELAAQAIGVALDDARGCTVTGGLPYFGGPGNDYTTHAIATMVERLRSHAEPACGLVTGLGWYVTKHSAGVYANRPPADGYRRADTSAAQRVIDATAVEVVDQVDPQLATVDAATVLYDRDGQVTAAPAIVRLSDGRRAVARADERDLPALAGTNLVGGTVHVAGGPARYQVAELASRPG